MLLSQTSDSTGAWRIETSFRGLWQVAGLAACQGWFDQAMVRHVALAGPTFVALQRLRRDPGDGP